MTSHTVSLVVSGTSVNQVIYTITVPTAYESLFASIMTSVTALIATDIEKLNLIPLFKTVFDNLV